MTLELQIAFLSALAALASAFWAWSSARTAKRALLIAEEDAASKRERIGAYLVSSLKWHHATKTYVSFACTYTNGSNSGATLERIELVVHAFDHNGQTKKILLPPTSLAPKNSDFAALPLPLNFPAKTTASGWLSFCLPPSLRQELSVDKYEVVATTATGKRVSVEAHLVIEERT